MHANVKHDACESCEPMKGERSSERACFSPSCSESYVGVKKAHFCLCLVKKDKVGIIYCCQCCTD